MIPATITHTTPYSERPRPVIECDPKTDKARQEFKKDCDVNLIIKKYGGNLPMNPVKFGMVDFDVDLLRAHTALSAVQSAYNALSPDVRGQYPSVADFASAVISGQFKGSVEAEVPSASETAPPSATATGGA